MAIHELSGYVTQNTLECHTLQQFCGNAKQAFATKRYDVAISQLTAAIDEINRNLLANILLKRAVVQGVQGTPGAGLVDAYKVIELLPDQPEGYLCSASLLRSMGENSSAMRVYTVALNRLNSENREQEQGYSWLVRAKCNLENEIDSANTRLLRKLPLELLGNIFASNELLSVRDRLECTRTCRAWRSFLLDEIPRMWREVSLVDMPQDVMLRQLSSVRSTQIRKVRIQFKSRNKIALTECVIRFLIEHGYNRLETLEICSELRENDTRAFGVLRQLFLQNQHTLRNVVVHCKSFRVGIVALDSCPRLVKLVSCTPYLGYPSSFTSEALLTPSSSGNEVFQLHFRRHMALMRARQEEIRMSVPAPANNDNAFTLAMSFLKGSELYKAINQNAELKPHHSLTKLELSGLQLSYFDEPFWRRLPHLDTLVIQEPVDMPGDFETLVKVLDQCCPKLKTFRFGGICEDPLLTTTVEEKKESGLVEVTMRGWSSAQSEINMISTLVRKSRDTLKMLRLPMEVLAASGSNVLTDLQVPRLRYLSIYGDPWRALDATRSASLVRNCPEIENLIIKLPVEETALVELSKAKRLRSFCLVDPAQPVSNGGTGLTDADVEALWIATNRNQRTSFRRFFENCNLLTDICFCGPLLSDADLIALATNTPHLESLKLLFCSSTSITTRGIMTFADSAPKGLRDLALMDLKCLDDDSLIRLLCELPSLEKMVLALCPPWMNNRRHISNCIEQAMGVRNCTAGQRLQITFAPAPGSQILLDCVPGKAIAEKSLEGIPSVFKVLLNIY
ncbi:hypothetical protein BDB00DRAFT_856891 [Zychaea mexicana]|uniref:uncharacterized protein n=1 Tax=Zychaea mexicana TaxID=64656 RepID=UPI0022FDD21A|nr:uncharacterized protein BDB00DRAFT_856891 [Zychaea mexicana]KAI9482628.1 hypothetical protein BDB00DRAFT_856891 [Zychaea mexicana]